MLVQLDDATQHALVIVKMSVPVSVTEHDQRSAIGPTLVVAVKKMAQKGLNAQDIEVVSRCLYAPGCDGTLAAIDPHLGDAVRRKILEAAIPCTQVHIIGIRRVALITAGALNGVEALRPWDLERPQDQTIHHAEHNGVGAYRHRQCQGRCERETWRFAQLPHCVAKILDPAAHSDHSAEYSRNCRSVDSGILND